MIPKKPFKKGFGSSVAPYYKTAGGTPFSITNTDSAFDITTQTVYTFSTKSIGTADASRLVVIACSARQAGTVGAASGITVGGNAATLVVSGVSTGTTSTVDIYQCALPTGTTATVVVTYPSSMARCGMSVFSVLGSNGVAPSGAAITTSINNGASQSTPITGTITVPTGGGSIVLGSGSQPPTFTATNYTEDVDFNGGATLGVTSGHDTSGTTGSRLYTITQSVACNQPVGAFAAWGP